MAALQNPPASTVSLRGPRRFFDVAFSLLFMGPHGKKRIKIIGFWLISDVSCGNTGENGLIMGEGLGVALGAQIFQEAEPEFSDGKKRIKDGKQRVGGGLDPPLALSGLPARVFSSAVFVVVAGAGRQRSGAVGRSQQRP